MIEVIIYENDITFLSAFALKKTHPKFIEQKFSKLQGEINIYIKSKCEFLIFFSIVNKSNK